MPPQDTKAPNPVLTLRDAVSLVEDAIALIDQALAKNPSKGEERTLQATRTELTLKRATLDAKLTALVDKSRQIAGPTATQVVTIASLTGQVQMLTNASTMASAAVALTSKVLTLATEIAGA